MQRCQILDSYRFVLSRETLFPGSLIASFDVTGLLFSLVKTSPASPAQSGKTIVELPASQNLQVFPRHIILEDFDLNRVGDILSTMA
jgi:hypothetical protein